MCGAQLKDSKIDADAGFVLRNRVVVSGKQCALVWKYVEVEEYSHLRGIGI